VRGVRGLQAAATGRARSSSGIANATTIPATTTSTASSCIDLFFSMPGVVPLEELR